MKPIPNYEDVVPATYGNNNQLPAGGYICKVVAVQETQSKNGNDMLEMNIDIIDGEYKDFFKTKYNNQTPYPDGTLRKWPGIHRLVLGGDNWEGRFKQFMTSLQESNPGFFWISCNWDTSKLVGLKFGGIFREEEFMGNQGIASTTKLWQVRSVDTIKNGDFQVPNPKKYIQSPIEQQPADDLPF